MERTCSWALMLSKSQVYFSKHCYLDNNFLNRPIDSSKTIKPTRTEQALTNFLTTVGTK